MKNVSAHLLGQKFSADPNTTQVEEKENQQDNNSSQKIIRAATTRSGGYKSKHNRLRQGNLSGSHERDLSLSTYSSPSDGHGNKSGNNTTNNNLDRLFGKNYFLDGEQLMRHMSPSTPNRGSIDQEAD